MFICYNIQGLFLNPKLFEVPANVIQLSDKTVNLLLKGKRRVFCVGSMKMYGGWMYILYSIMCF